ncbi:MAG: hypothetical protein ABWK53_03855 [Anaerolineales bacterium]
MPAELDLYLLPFNRVKGQEWPQLPGLLATAPPRRAARGRESDWLIVYLSLAGNAPFTSSEYAQLVAQLAERFYQIPGALTSAMRSVIEMLNQFLTDRNRKLSSVSQQSSGRLIFGVLRGRQLTLAQSGPTHAFHLAPEGVRHFQDETLSGRGLGHGSATPIYFSQMTLQPGDQVLLCAELPSAWQAALEAERGLAGLEARRRKLLSLTDEDLNAVLIQTQAGKGRVEVLQAMKPAVEIAAPLPADLGPVAPPAVPPAERPASRFSRLMAGGSQPPSEAPASAPEPVRQAAAPSAPRPASLAPRQAVPLPEIERPSPARRRQVYGSLARFLQRARLLNERLAQAMREFLPRLLPGMRPEGPPLSNTFLAFVAIVIPLALVVAASTVYVRYGKSSQYEENYQLAVQAAVGAIGQTDPAVVRHAWESCLYYLDRAEVYLVTQESRELRRIAQSALDSLDGIVRLEFRQISGSLGEDRRITRMAATEDGLFLLDAAGGEVLHALLTQQEARLNDFFRCGPGVYNGLQVGPLIDLAALPPINTRNADVLAMDGSGTLLYCSAGSEPVAVALAGPSVGWTGVRNFSLDIDGRNLYLLDQNAVWVYAGSLGEFTDLPISFFSEQVPQNMNQVIDLAISGDDLYLLFQDGHMAACTLSRLSVVPTRCTDPLTFVDERPGHVSGVTIADAIFSQMMFGPTPDPSLYLLEPLTQAVYRFAPRADSMAMQSQFRAGTDLVQAGFAGQQATAMAFGPNRDLFLCVGNKIYYAGAVP